MVRKRLELEKEVQDILNLEDNFLLSGGAGSGKTYSLVATINQVISENLTSKVACITFTNAAVKEIEERISHKNLTVSTIHDFLWNNIKHFQKHLKSSLVKLMNDEESKIKNPEENPVAENYFKDIENGIQYKEYLKIKEGVISHDYVLILANFLFKEYPRLCSILKDKFQFVFIDEYQDTEKQVVDIFLKYLKEIKNKKNIIGFFGDSMQSIYDKGIGYLKNDNDYNIEEVKKKQNRRNPQLIIDFANKLRTDGIEQTPSEDKNAPNMENGEIKEGGIKFYYSLNDDISDIDFIKSKIGWNFNDSKETKILNLTHNLIASKAGFKNLMEIYDKDPIIAIVKAINTFLKDVIYNTICIKPSSNFGEVICLVEEVEQLKKKLEQLKILEECNPDLYHFAEEQKWGNFKKLYKENLIDDEKRDDLIKHLFKIQNNIFLYKSKQFNQFIRKTEYKVDSIEKKEVLKKQIEELIKVENKTIEEVIEKSDKYGICRKDDKLSQFIKKQEYLYYRVKKIKFFEFQKLYDYLEGHTPFSTQHNTKGNEFNNVLIILDNGGWNNYNFECLFNKNTNASNSTVERTKKLFYVCCTRAKENLALFFHKPSDQVIAIAKEFFGEDNIKEIDK